MFVYKAISLTSLIMIRAKYVKFLSLYKQSLIQIVIIKADDNHILLLPVGLRREIIHLQ